jgi:hypothetical protein
MLAMDPRIYLYFLSALSGVIMITGGIWLIYKEKIYIDRESKQPIEIQSPLGSFKSNYPALTLFVIGFFPLTYPIYAVNNLSEFIKVDTVRIKGLVEANAYPVLVYAARAQDSLTSNGEFGMPVPFLGRGLDDYRVLLVVNGHVLDDQRVERSANSGEIEVTFKPVVVEPPAYQADLAPVPPGYR